MRQSDPPRAAAWMLRHLVPGERNDALAGDLLEEFRSGRSAAWYWCQVFASITIAYSHNIYANGSALLFAAFWTLLAPVCIPLPSLTHFSLFEREFWKLDAIWNLPYPWSNICNLGLTFLLMIAFVWIGLLIYLALESIIIARRISFWRLRRGMMRSAAVFAPFYVAIFGSLTLILPGFAIRLSREAHHHPFGPLMLAESACAPFFITFIWAVWDASRAKNPRKQPLQDKPGQGT